MTHRLIVNLKGGLLLGGTAVGGFHDVSLRDAKGLPYIPASALKGAIRQQMGRLAPFHEGGARTSEDLFGKPGHDPQTERQPGADQLEDFGGGTTRVYLSDAVLVEDEHRALFTSGLGWSPRTQVSIDRRSRRAADQRLYNREVLAPFVDGLRFEARLDLSKLGDEDFRLFDASVRAVFALGASRTAGLGRVEMRLEEAADERSKREEASPDPLDGAKAIDLVLTAVDPICLADRITGNFIRTQDFIRASTLRGAIITAALAKRNVKRDLRRDPEFQRLFLDDETCVRFGDAWSTEGESTLPRADTEDPCGRQEASTAPERLSPRGKVPGERASWFRVAPQTMRACKKKHRDRPDEQWHEDVLLRSYLQILAAERSTFIRPPDHCRICGGRRKPVPGTLGAGSLERRVVTRVRIDPRSGRAGDGQLFSIELLERGTTFRARVSGLDAESRAYLRDAARQGLRVGHGRGQGYGRMSLEFAPATTDPLRPRLERFDRTLRQALGDLAAVLRVDPAELGADRRHVAVTLLSALQLGGEASTAEAAFLEALELDGVEAVYSQVRTDQRGGWDAMSHRPKPLEPTLLAGSVLLLRSERPLDDLEPALARLEARGAGAAREEGFGWLRVSDPIHLAHGDTDEP